MRIVYSIPTRIGAGGLGVGSLETLKGIYANGYLEKVVAYGNRQTEIPARYIRSMRFHATKIFSNLPARYYYPAKAKSLDRKTVRILRKGGNLFHGWTGSSLRSLEYCRDRKIVSILENPAPHPRHSAEIMEREYDSLGIRWKKEPEVLKSFFGTGLPYYEAEYDAAEYILLQSEFTRSTFLARGFPADRLRMVPRGIDTSRFVPPPERRSASFRALFVGAIGVRKGVRYLLEAWKELALKGAELLLVGTVRDDVRPVLEKEKDNTTIRVLGYVSDPVRLYQEASVFLFPSLSEGSAKVTYEAMACGLPVIVTPNAGSVAVDGEHGFIIPVQDKQILKERILTIYENPGLREEMGRKARRHIESFSWDAFRQRMLEMYETAFRARSGSGTAEQVSSRSEEDS
jgi:glycosyltransferase involved in cell wall biosynthesis